MNWLCKTWIGFLEALKHSVLAIFVVFGIPLLVLLAWISAIRMFRIGMELQAETQKAVLENQRVILELLHKNDSNHDQIRQVFDDQQRLLNTLVEHDATMREGRWELKRKKK